MKRAEGNSSRVLGNFSPHNRRLTSHLRWRRSSPNIGKPKFPRQAILGSKQRALGAHQLRLRKGELPRPRLATLFSLLLSTAAPRCHRQEHAVPPRVELVIAIANSTPAITVARRNIRLLRHIFTRDLVPVLVIDDDVFKMRVFGIGPVRATSILAAWAEQKVVPEIMVFLHSHGVGTGRCGSSRPMVLTPSRS